GRRAFRPRVARIGLIRYRLPGWLDFVSGIVRQLRYIEAVREHRVDVRVPVATTRKSNPRAVRRPRRPRITRAQGKPYRIGTVGIHRVDLISRSRKGDPVTGRRPIRALTLDVGV